MALSGISCKLAPRDRTFWSDVPQWWKCSTSILSKNVAMESHTFSGWCNWGAGFYYHINDIASGCHGGSVVKWCIVKSVSGKQQPLS